MNIKNTFPIYFSTGNKKYISGALIINQSFTLPIRKLYCLNRDAVASQIAKKVQRIIEKPVKLIGLDSDHELMDGDRCYLCWVARIEL